MPLLSLKSKVCQSTKYMVFISRFYYYSVTSIWWRAKCGYIRFDLISKSVDLIEYLVENTILKIKSLDFKIKSWFDFYIDLIFCSRIRPQQNKTVTRKNGRGYRAHITDSWSLYYTWLIMRYVFIYILTCIIYHNYAELHLYQACM